MNTKQEYIKEVSKFLHSKIVIIQDALLDTQESANSETKSSAGDKHETSRAMAQLEIERLGKQLKLLQNQLETLHKIDPTKNGNKISFGSVVQCESFCFFISIGLGKITFNKITFFAIAPNSPVGKELLNKKENDTIHVGNKTHKIVCFF